MGDSSLQTRFLRQVAFGGIGAAGQARLASTRVAVVGVGALGGAAAMQLTRMGIGNLRLIDRDVVELSNLPRQVLFDASHAEARTPKAEAAALTLARIGGPTRIEARVNHLGPENLSACFADVDLVLDGTDNLETRYLINDWSVRSGTPWVYAGVVGSEGRALAIEPGRGACLRCVFPEPPAPGVLATCDSAGVILPAVLIAAGWQVGLALELLVQEPGRPQTDARSHGLISFDIWSGSTRRTPLVRDPDCPCCGQRRFEFLERGEHERAVALCGRNAVQVPGRGRAPDVQRLASRLTASGVSELKRAGSLLRFEVEGLEITVFPDGRSLVQGTEDLGRAQALCKRWLL